MKLFNILLPIIFSTTAFTSNAQNSKLEITPYAGYTFSGRQSYVSAETDMKDAASLGLSVDYRVDDSKMIGVMYHVIQSNVDATIYWGPVTGNEKRTTPIRAEYYHIGGTQEFSQERVRPFTALSIGMTRFAGTDDTKSTIGGVTTYESMSDIWSLSASLGGGAKISLSKSIGIRLKANLLLPMYFNGIGVYCGNGCGGGASFGVYFLQLDVSGGLIIALGQN